MEYISAEEQYAQNIINDSEEIWSTVGGDEYAHLIRIENQNKQIRKTQLEQARQIREIHAFIAGIGQALNHPMLRGMVPVELQSLLNNQNGN